MKTTSATRSGSRAARRSSWLAFLTQRRDPRHNNAADILTYLYMLAGIIVMFGPVLWLVMSSFKPASALGNFPPTFLPYYQKTVVVEGYEEPLPLYNVKMEDGSNRVLAQVSRIGLEARLVDPVDPSAGIIKTRIENRTPVEEIRFAVDNYTGAIQKFPFLRYLWNTVFVTVMATIVTLLINSMAAYALSKYHFRGRDAILVIIISTLMVPVSVIMIPAFLVIAKVNLVNNLWGLIIPGAATPTGVFLLRQYMLTIPDELIDAARIDGAGEWRIYYQVILPLAAPAMAVLAIFSVMWRWNDFLWPLIVINRSELFTLQVGLNAFQGDLNVQWHYILAMTVLTLLPITLVFAFLQRYITSGIATTGIKG